MHGEGGVHGSCKSHDSSRRWQAASKEYFTSGKVTAGNNHITKIESTLRIDCIQSIGPTVH